MKKKALGKHYGKRGKAQMEQCHPFPQCFLCNLYLKNPLIATFQLLSEASVNMGLIQNRVLGNGLNIFLKLTQFVTLFYF